MDNNDPDKRGKVLIRVLPEFKDVATSLLPWALPFFSKQSSDSMTNDLPDNESKIRIFVDKNWKRFYYFPNRFFETLFDFSSIETKLQTISGMDTTYKNIKFRKYPDGGLEFHNTDNGEHGFIHKSGSYQWFDSDGNILLNTGTAKFKLNDATNVGDLKDILKDLRTVLVDLLTPGNLTNGGGPVVIGTVIPDNLILTNLVTKLNAVLKD